MRDGVGGAAFAAAAFAAVGLAAAGLAAAGLAAAGFAAGLLAALAAGFAAGLAAAGFFGADADCFISNHLYERSRYLWVPTRARLAELRGLEPISPGVDCKLTALPHSRSA
ncbi:hypothetical protein AO933_34605 [Pseudomonas aeruginosa]|uniref:hypothetical protein n=1 Tax=Pseudomonas aeruginosa TaxID=287 RepID=UPI0009AE1F4F|nr:hypothetical protein [Pseudomonas aeruginosa]OPD39333.1 hypothetical protein AO933_34605 [Pseudomonas aeruginosa]